MNQVIYYSNTGQSLQIAQYFSKTLGYSICNVVEATSINYNNLILVFPVHSQNLPIMIKKFLKKVTVTYLTAIATYGKMCCGNVLYEIQKKYKMNLIAGAYVPTKHSYLKNDKSFQAYEQLNPILEKIKNPRSIKIPKLYKNIFSNFLPRLRSKLSLKLIKTAKCCSCGACTRACDFKAIKEGIPNHKCIRCLKCITICPYNALDFKQSFLLQIYLKKQKSDQFILYI